MPISVYAGQEFPLKEFLPVGVFILDAFKHSFNTGYDRKRPCRSPSFMDKQGLLMLRVHWGGKITQVFLALLFAGFVGMFTEIDGGYLFLYPAGDCSCCVQRP